MSLATPTTVNSFDTDVLKSDLPVIVDFWAVWCGPCRALAPTLDAIASEYAGKVKIFKVNVDEERELATKYGIQGIPALILFKNGDIVGQLVGNQPKPNIEEAIKKMIE